MTTPGRLRAAAKRWLVWLGSRPWFRPVGVALVRALNRGTFRLLEGTPGVRRVYLRGSVARGDFTPIRSDVDLALVLTAEGARDFDTVAAVHDAMRRARRRNPCIRDWWHHLIAEPELPVVEAFSDLYGSREWRDAEGRASAPRSDWVDERLRAAAAWSQLCLWSGSAFHAFLHPDDRIHNFEAGVKKSMRFAERLGAGASAGGSAGGGSAAASARNCSTPEPSPSHRRARLLHVYREIERGAERMVGGSDPPVSENAGPSAPRTIRAERAAFLVLEDGLTDHQLTARFDELGRRGLPDAVVTYMLPAAALAAWPFPAEDVVAGDPPPPMPLPLAREVYLFEALFLPSALRLAVAFPDAAGRLRRTCRSLRRACRLYGRGGDECGAPPGDTADARDLFAQGAALCDGLQRSLLAFAGERAAGDRSPRSAAR